MHFVLLRTETTSYFDRSGTLVLCARQLDEPPQVWLMLAVQKECPAYAD